MNKTIPFAIIGAGPAGLAAAIACGPGAVIIERNREAGVKLLLSGSGQCNFTNTLAKTDFIRACRKAGPFLKPSVYSFDNDYFINLLGEAGCPSIARKDGKVFPVSLKAEHVRDALLKAALLNGADIVYNVHVLSIQKTKTGFSLKTKENTIHCKKLLLACGGASWQQTGSTGDGYAFAQALGHTINPIKPSLASIETAQTASFSHSAGSTVTNVKADFISSGSRHSDTGDLLFTHRGLSGPLILNNSHLISKGDTVRIHLLPEAEKLVSQALQTNPKRNIINALKILPLTEAILTSTLHYLRIYIDTPVRELNKKQINQIIGFLTAADFTVSKVESFATSMSTAGGVVLKEVNSHTMESRLVPGLYLAGEVLDYALPTGGFNIQAAFSTGSLAGKSARV